MTFPVSYCSHPLLLQQKLLDSFFFNVKMAPYLGTSYCFIHHSFISQIFVEYLPIIELGIVLHTRILPLCKRDNTFDLRVGGQWLNKEIRINLHHFDTNVRSNKC